MKTVASKTGVRGIIVLLLIFFQTGCAVSSVSEDGETAANNSGLFIAVEWNVQALFDGKDNGNEYDDYLESSLWNSEKYAARMTAVSEAAARMLPEGMPDLIGFVEVENAAILDEFAENYLSKHGYFWTAFAKTPGSSLGIGFISRFPILSAKAHSVTAGNDAAPRPVLEARVEPDGKPLVFMLCHWKSKLGGAPATEAARRASARVVARRLRELKESEPETPVIVMGDLNENHDEFFRNSEKSVCALLPDDPRAENVSRSGGQTDFLVLSGEKPPLPVFFPPETLTLYSPWYETGGGSYNYRDKWETIDHCLLSEGLFDNSGWDFADFRVLDDTPFAAASGKPDAYIPRNGRGLSDHLPLLLVLRDCKEAVHSQ